MIRWLSARKVAEMCDLHVCTVRRAIDRGDLPAYQPGGPGTAVRIKEADVEAWQTSGRRGSTAVNVRSLEPRKRPALGSMRALIDAERMAQ